MKIEIFAYFLWKQSALMTVIWMVQWLYLLISKVNLQILLTKMFFAHHKAKHFLMVSFFKKKKKKKHNQNQLKCSKKMNNAWCIKYDTKNIFYPNDAPTLLIFWLLFDVSDSIGKVCQSVIFEPSFLNIHSVRLSL